MEKKQKGKIDYSRLKDKEKKKAMSRKGGTEAVHYTNKNEKKVG